MFGEKFNIDELFKTDKTFEEVKSAFEKAKTDIEQQIKALNKRKSLIDDRQKKATIIDNYLEKFKELEKKVKTNEATNEDFVAFEHPILSKQEENTLAKPRGFRGSLFGAELFSDTESFKLIESFQEKALIYFKYTILAIYKKKCETFLEALNGNATLPPFPELSLAQQHLLGHKAEKHIFSNQKDILDVYKDATTTIKEKVSEDIVKRYKEKKNKYLNSYSTEKEEWQISHLPFLTKNEISCLTDEDFVVYAKTLKGFCKEVFVDRNSFKEERKNNYFKVISGLEEIFLWHIDYILSEKLNPSTLACIGTIGIGIQVLLKNKESEKDKLVFWETYIKLCSALLDSLLERSFPEKSFLTIFLVAKQDKLAPTSIETSKNLIELKNVSAVTLDSTLQEKLYDIACTYGKRLRKLAFIYNLEEIKNYLSDSNGQKEYIQEQIKAVKSELSVEELNSEIKQIKTGFKQIFADYVKQKCLLLFKEIEVKIKEKEWEEANLITVPQEGKGGFNIIEDYFPISETENKPKVEKLLKLDEKSFESEINKLQEVPLDDITMDSLGRLFQQMIEKAFDELKKAAKGVNPNQETFADVYKEELITSCVNELKKIKCDDFYISLSEFGKVQSLICKNFLDKVKENIPLIEREELSTVKMFECNM